MNKNAPGVYAPDGEEPDMDKIINKWMKENPEQEGEVEWTDKDISQMISIDPE